MADAAAPAAWAELVRFYRASRTDHHLHAGSIGPQNPGEYGMAKGQQRGNREARKPKKPEPPKQNASNPSLKGTPQAQLPKKG